VIPPHVVRVLASARIPSSYGPDVDYELVHAVVSSGADHTVTHESVLIRLVVGNTAQNNRAAEVLVQDLPAVQAQWVRFVQDVLWRRAQGGDTEARAELDKMAALLRPPAPSTPPPASPAISASGGRYGRTDPTAPDIPIFKEKKKGQAPPPEAPIIPGVTAAGLGQRKYFGKIIDAPGPEEPAPERETKARTPDKYQVIAFSLSSPPTADGLMKTIQSLTDHLIVVAPMSHAERVEDFIKGMKGGTVKGRPTEFNPIVIRRTAGEPVTNKKLRAEVAGGIARMLGDTGAVLWIMPEYR